MLADGTIAAEAGEEAAGDGDVACDLGTEVFGAVESHSRKCGRIIAYFRHPVFRDPGMANRCRSTISQDGVTGSSALFVGLAVIRKNHSSEPQAERNRS